MVDPKRRGILQRGCIYWAKLANEKCRPVLVLSPVARNERANDVIVAPISTVLREGPWHVRLRKNEAGLPQQSVIKCELITTLRQEHIDPGAIGGPVSAQRMSEVTHAVLRAIGVSVD